MRKFSVLILAILIFGCSKEDNGGTPEPIDTGVTGPVAIDDQATTVENTVLVISGLMDNDEVQDYARISEFDTKSEKGGSIVDNRDGSYSYFPPENYIGKDNFYYTICDNAETPNCSTAAVNITITESTPKASDDTYEMEEESILLISSYLNNDQVVDNATLSTVDFSGARGEVTVKTNGDLEYSPAEGFSGTDSFTYTICDDDETPACSTATIRITVLDEGSPDANDDRVVVESGTTEIVLNGLLENDIVLDEAAISFVDISTGSGSVVINPDGTLTYSSNNGGTGEDVFEYTICDDDGNPTCSSALVTIVFAEPIAFNIPAELQEYYANAVFTSDPTMLYSELFDLSDEKHVNKLEYYERHDYLYDADADLTNPEYVVLMYTGELRPWQEYQQGSVSEGETFNTEHIFPQSKLASEAAKNDLHHMRVADIGINSTRSNHPFVDGSGEAILVNGNSWYPGDEWKGDVARMVMYINVRYGESFTDVGNIELFLEWNAEDPVSALELQRQEIIEGAQGNRNPFIDNPYLATLIWGGIPAANHWE